MLYISPQVLVLASRYDFSCDYVIAQLQKRDVSYFRLNSEDFKEFAVVGDLAESSVSLFSNDLKVHLNQETLKSIYFRRAVYPREPRKDRDLPQEQLSRTHISAFMRNLMIFDGCMWINHPVATYKAEHKGVQLQTAHRIGFDIPRTVVTNDARGIRQAAQKDSKVAIKGLETVLVWQDSLETFGYTSLVDSSLAAQAHLASAPLVAQQALEEKLDLRVTVVGDQVFCASITVNGRPVNGDWRLKKTDAEFRPFDLPHDISAKCLDYTETLNLSFGAIDLALHNGRFYFLEINPTGEWGWLVDDAQLAIDVALADALLNYRLRIISRTWTEVSGQIFDLLSSNRILGSRIACWESRNFKSAPEDGRLNLGLCVLQRDLELEHIRRQGIEDKAKTNVFSITLVTAMFAGFLFIALNILKDDLGTFTWAVPLLMLCGAMLFLLFGGLIALNTLRMDKVALWTAEDEILPIEEQKATLIGYMEYNRLINIKKSNKVDTSYVCIRNGVVILAVVILLSVFISVCEIL